MSYICDIKNYYYSFIKVGVSSAKIKQRAKMLALIYDSYK